MRKKLAKEVRYRAMSLISGITYAQVESWFGGTYRDLKMTVICPKEMKEREPMPIIVWLCGGGFYRMDRNIWLPQIAELSKRGFVIASPDYRTSGEAAFPEPLRDIKSAIRYLRANCEKFCVDPNRVYIMGESAGGAYSALCGVTNGRKEYDAGEFLEFSSDVQGVVDFYGPTDLRPFYHMMDKPAAEEDASARAALYLRTHRKEASAIEQVGQRTPKTLIFHGTADELVPVEQSESFYKKLQQTGVKSDLYIIEGASHGDDAFFQEQIYDLIADFLNEEGE